jgi:hypothetical protein
MQTTRLQPQAARDPVWGYGVNIDLTIDQAIVEGKLISKQSRTRCPPIVIFGAH